MSVSSRCLRAKAMKGHRIMFISTGLAYGGAETQLVHIAIRLKARGWEVYVVSLMPPRAYAEELERTGIPVVSLDICRKLIGLRPVLLLARLIRKWQPSIVHSFMVHANLLARSLRLLVPIPVLICSARSLNEGGRLRELLYRLTDPLCDLTTQVSRTGLERYVQIGIVPAHKIRYIPNGVDTERFCPDPEVRKRLREDLRLGKRFVWLAVGRFAPPKDYPNMLRAFAVVVYRYPEALLLIVGDGPLRPSMEKLTEDLHISTHVKFLGVRRDIPNLMNAADAYVMSSAWEGMPNVLLEAHATGLPIVATDVGGNREVVIEGVTGFLVHPRNPDALAQTMIRLMDLSEEERRRMGEAARRHINENFNLNRVIDQWEDLYRELLTQKGLL